ncbi:MAG: pseudouridine synthase [Alphaproteobacteria bacterium]
MSEDNHKGDRIAKVMARAGVCSRRDAERWIDQGRVSVNGKVISSPALNVTSEDQIIVDKKPLPQIQDTRLFLYHKPAGLVTSHKDEQGRSTVFDHLPGFLPRVVSVGRLDLNTEGLLLLTNDGGLSRFLELPETGWSRRYRVRVHGKVDEKRLESLQKGITIDGVRYKSIDAVLEPPPEGEDKIGANSWITITLKEGKNREIRRVMEELGLDVTRLIRTDYGPFSLGNLAREAVVEVKRGVLKNQVAKYFSGQKLEKIEKTYSDQNSEKKKKSPKNAVNSKKYVQIRDKNTKFKKKDEK